MVLLLGITFQSGDFYYSTSNSTGYFVLIVSVIAVFISFINFRFQLISLVQKQLTDKANLCNENIDKETQRILDTPHNISKIVSSIITAKFLVERLTEKKVRMIFFPFGYGRQSLIDHFYLQLHSSIIDYIMKNTITPSFQEGRVKFHLKLQLDYCSRFFIKSISKYGNATPKEIQDELDKYDNEQKNKII